MDINSKIRDILAAFQHDNLNYTDYIDSHPTASDEAVVRLKIAEPLLQALGYDLQTDLVPEHRVKEGAIDILVTAGGKPVMLWELKRTQELNLAIHEEQLTRYVLAEGVTHAVLCNGRELRVYLRVGEFIRQAYILPLIPFAPNAPMPPTENEILALTAFFDAFHKESFLKVERLKDEIATPPAPSLILSPENIQNESLLIEELKREIRRLHRHVLLRFRCHRAIHEAFMAEDRRREKGAAAARVRLLNWLDGFETHANGAIQANKAALEDYLADFAAHWNETENEEFIAEVLSRSALKPHLSGVNLNNFKTRADDFYRAYTQYIHWHNRQLVELRPSRHITEDFTQWKDEIGLMAEDYEAEFCLQTVYIFVTRLLLIRICEDKGLISQKISDGGYKFYLDFSAQFFTYIANAHAILLNIAYEDTSHIYGHFFRHNVFDWYDWEEEAIIRTFWVINRFDFAQVSADLIGRIYEQYVDELERKRKGQFYTPPQVINYILDQVGYRGAEITSKRLLDPACGSGRFLVEAARRLIPELQKQADTSAAELVNERLRNSLFGLDVNRFACFLAEVNLLVQVLGLFKDARKVTIARFHIYPTNSLLPLERAVSPLIAMSMENGTAYEVGVAELIKRRGQGMSGELDFRGGFDWVVGNPPYVRADNPGVAVLREHIQNSGLYETLYKKWDLYIPFIEFALRELAQGGRHGFIVSDAYQTEEYAHESREMLLCKTTIESLTFAPGVNFFEEAQVHNLIYAVRKAAPPTGHKVARYKVVAPALNSRDIKTLPALAQDKWGEQIFRPEFAGEDGLDFSACVPLGKICYITGGLEMQSHEKYDFLIGDKRRKLFVKDDLLSLKPSDKHIKPYAEAGDMKQHVLCQTRWLEWGTSRVPRKLRRRRFPELFDSEKIMVARITTDYLTAVYDRNQNIVTNHTIIHNVPYQHLLPIKNKVARLLARHLTQEELEQYSAGTEKSKTEVAKRVIEEYAQISTKFDARFLTALLNVKWLSRYILRTSRRGRLDFYPDDLKQYPIARADADTQARIAYLVDEIMSAKADVQRWRDEGQRIDEDEIVLNPRLFLDYWNIYRGDLFDAANFVKYQIEGYPTDIEIEGTRLTFRKQPLSYFESEYPHVLEYLRLYLETNANMLSALPVAQLYKHILIPRSPQAVRDFMDKLAKERERVMLRWMTAAQYGALIEELAFELYEVGEEKREDLGGKLYTFGDVPPETGFVSILDNESDNPMRRVAFRQDDVWYYRAAQPLPNAVLLWMHDGENVTTDWRAV